MLDHILTNLHMVNSLTKLLTKGKFDKLGENLGLLEKKSHKDEVLDYLVGPSWSHLSLEKLSSTRIAELDCGTPVRKILKYN